MKFIPRETVTDKRLINYISEKYNIHRYVAELLIMRGYGEDLDSFFSDGELHNPLLLNDMSKAVEAINSHISRKSKITIYGDYDVDGVCATAILYLFFKSLDVNVEVYLPDRHEDGYGLNNNAIDKIALNGTKLLITVDCGISNVKETEYAIEKGLEVIITDHHQCPAILPECTAVVNPLLADYPYRFLCGSGVALKLAEALGGKEALDKYCDLSALATVADLVPLTGENRGIVKRGLKHLSHESCRCGIRALADTAGIKDEITAGQIAFGIGPRINAAGRMALAKEAFDLIVCEDYNSAVAKAEILNKYNDKRKKQESDVLTQAKEQIEAMHDRRTKRIILVCGDGWNKGIIGNVASKLVEEYKRPVIVFSNEDGICVGSGRSITGVHLFNLLNNFGDMFIKFGGHEMAAGMSIKADKLNELSIKLNNYAINNYNDEIFIPSMVYDLEIELNEINNKLVKDIEKLAPMGMGNKTPCFCVKNAELKNVRLIGNEQTHIKLSVVKNEVSLDGVGFSLGKRSDEIRQGCKYDIIVNLEINSWNNRDSIQLQIKEFKPSVSIENNQLISLNGNKFFNSLMQSVTLPVEKVKFDRIRQMWNWHIYLQRRLKKDVFNTAVYSSIPTCSYELLYFLNKEGLTENVDYYFGAPEENSCVVFAPDWSVDELPYSRLVIFDYAPTDFINRVLTKNPDIQIVICNNDFTDNYLSKFFMGIEFNREKAGLYYSILRSVCKTPLDIDSAIAHFCRIGNETEFNAYSALNIFAELELLGINEGNVYMKSSETKKDLFSSSTVKKLVKISDKIRTEVDMLLPPRNNKGKRI